VKFLNQPRLAQSRLTHKQDQLPVALPRPLPASHQHGDFLVAPNQRCQMALPRSASAAAGADDPKQRHRLRQAFQLMGTTLLGEEQTRGLALHARRDHDRSRRRRTSDHSRTGRRSIASCAGQA
jgi:hypothetical protein